MKNKIVSILSALTAAVLLVCLCSCKSTNSSQKFYIAVITKATDSDFWSNVQRGVNSAATEYNVAVTFGGPDDEQDFRSQNDMIEKAVRDGADAIVLSAIDYNKTAEAVDKAAAAGVKIIMIDSGVNSDEISAFIGTDNYSAGKTAAKSAVDCAVDKGVKELNIGLVNYGKSSDNGQQRESGVRDYIKSYSSKDVDVNIVSSINVQPNTTSAAAGTIRMLYANPDINCLIGFNEWMTLGMGNAIRQQNNGDSIIAVGFDSNVVSIGMLETGEMDALIVQNPFAIGYTGVECAYNLLSGKSVEPNIFTDTTPVTSKNMFDADKQKILFKFDQR